MIPARQARSQAARAAWDCAQAGGGAMSARARATAANVIIVMPGIIGHEARGEQRNGYIERGTEARAPVPRCVVDRGAEAPPLRRPAGLQARRYAATRRRRRAAVRPSSPPPRTRTRSR